MNHLCQTIHHHQNGIIRIRSGRFVMKSMGIEDHGDVGIDNGLKRP
jgi:hypothetical protein